MGGQNEDSSNNFFFNERGPLFPGPKQGAAVVAFDNIVPDEVFGLVHNHADTLVGTVFGRGVGR